MKICFHGSVGLFLKCYITIENDGVNAFPDKFGKVTNHDTLLESALTFKARKIHIENKIREKIR